MPTAFRSYELKLEDLKKGDVTVTVTSESHPRFKIEKSGSRSTIKLYRFAGEGFERDPASEIRVEALKD